MENNNQKIIFLVPEDTNLAKIILSILIENNIVQDPADASEEEIKKLTFINNIAKNIFEQKTTEREAINLLQEEFKTNNEIAIKIIDDVKQKIIPYAKKINISNKNNILTAPNNQSINLTNTKKQSQIIKPKNENLPEEVVIPKKNIRKKTIPISPIIEGSVSKPKKENTIDRYREIIE